MLKKKNYIGFSVEVYDCPFKNINGKKAIIRKQEIDIKNNLVFELNIPHPKDNKLMLWVKEDEIKLI